MLQSVETYRSLYRPFCEHLDTPTLADWPDSGKKMILFIESCVYLSAYETDHAIRSHLKAGKQAEEIFSHTPFVEWMSAIDDQIKAEAQAAADEATEKLKANLVNSPDADVTADVGAETNTQSSTEAINAVLEEKNKELQNFAAQRHTRPVRAAE